ncbi:ferrous iron transport protein B [Desulfovibrio sulfodismutans]|uniref:Ferrous iron transport protein B n=1 Tax=Desulfolutivibrio sulfodismutans TaxID=63561 RepID=A0A7K3NPM8_9BACT|nr:ferrous iron transport protein B [Desulfolutivibrio sulfodismutans]NDY58134.1 ferrous iron transport protein B [Desulfolutivibrio sulfodismutans]QLA11124.1 ferrous iron transport protein B [Desulfolutivibrio sulfodismutans DSM 3696]
MTGNTLTIALAGNPNSGKTTMFNALTGSRQHVGNYPGVTVQKKEGRLTHNGVTVHVVDLPGTYSLTAYSAEELAARNFLVDERPEMVVNILDAGALERSLYLTVQFLELGVPVVLALNMMDEVKKRGMQIDTGLLSRLLRSPVVETVARIGEGKERLLDAALDFARGNRRPWEPLILSYGPDVDAALAEMTGIIEDARFLDGRLPARWVALKLLEGDHEVAGICRQSGAAYDRLAAIVERLAGHLAATMNSYPEALISDYRYGFIASLLKQGVLKKDASRERIVYSDKVDRVVTDRFLGPLLMLGVLYGMFEMVFFIGEYPMGWFEDFFSWLSGLAAAVIPPGQIQSLVVSGIIGGVGGVLGFVPLIVIMFFLLSYLEDLGYMARMAYMLDRVFRIFGLHGGSVMPFIISGGIPGGCAVPGVMAARTLRSPKERLATILTAPFMACGAKIPVFVLLVGAFFPQGAGTAMFWITLASWGAALLVARLLRSTVIRGQATPFLMELPPYRIPTLRGVLLHTWERAWQYVKKAGTTILAISVLLWAAMTYPQLPQDVADGYATSRRTLAAALEAAETTAAPGLDGAALADLEARLADIDNKKAEAALRNSLAGRLGTALEDVTRLAGFDWRVNIALLGGIAAKEVIVSTLGTSYALGEVDPGEATPLSEKLAADPAMSKASALALIIFTILYAPCFVTVVAMAREASWGWAAFAMVFNTGLGFAVAAAAYQIASRL